MHLFFIVTARPAINAPIQIFDCRQAFFSVSYRCIWRYDRFKSIDSFVCKEFFCGTAVSFFSFQESPEEKHLMDDHNDEHIVYGTCMHVYIEL